MERAVLLAAGRGSRLALAQPAVQLSSEQTAVAEAGLKPLMPLGRFRLIDHALSTLAEIGIRRVLVVLGPHSEGLGAHLASLRPRRLTIETAVQAVPRGTADALLTAEAFARDAPFLMVNGDNLYPVAPLRELAEASGWAHLVLDRGQVLARGGPNLTSEKFASFARIECDADGYMTAIVEKPPPEEYTARVASGEIYLAGINAFRFEPEIFAACRTVRPSPRGELELPSAVAGLIAAGARFRVIVSPEPMLDLTDRSDVPYLEEQLRGRTVEI